MRSYDGGTKTFDFEHGGKAYSIPTVGSLPYPLLKRYLFSEGASGEVGLDFMVEVLNRYADGLADEMPTTELARLLRDYIATAKDVGEELGE